jgi:hypothetical protein
MARNCPSAENVTASNTDPCALYFHPLARRDVEQFKCVSE